MQATPEARITLGRLDERMISDERRNRTTYAIASFEKDYPNLGRVRVLDMLKLSRDAIADDRRDVSPFRRAGYPPLVQDVLPAQDTWVNTAWVGLDYTAVPNLRFANKLKYELYDNRAADPRDPAGRPLRAAPVLFGLVNKADYRWTLGNLTVQPKLKSEFLRRDAFLKAEKSREQWTGIATLVTQFPVLSRSSLTLGLELVQFSERLADEEEMLELGAVGETGDLRSLIGAIQLTNASEYLGYRLTTQVGFRLARFFAETVQLADRAAGQFEKGSAGATESTGFITVYAGQ